MYDISRYVDVASYIGWNWKIKTAGNSDLIHGNWRGCMKSLHRPHCTDKLLIEFSPIISIRTAALWAKYCKLVPSIKDFILDESLSDFWLKQNKLSWKTCYSLHSFTRYDTASQFYGFGKLNTLKRAPKLSGDPLMLTSMSVRTGQLWGQKGTIRETKILDHDVQQNGHQNQHKPTTTSRKKTFCQPAYRAGLSTSTTYHNWALLNTDSLDPQSYGRLHDSGNNMEPVPSTGPIVPETILKFISCNCSSEVDMPCKSNRCFCRQHEFDC